jgi:hypothetical protein
VGGGNSGGGCTSIGQHRHGQHAKDGAGVHFDDLGWGLKQASTCACVCVSMGGWAFGNCMHNKIIHRAGQCVIQAYRM